MTSIAHFDARPFSYLMIVQTGVPPSSNLSGRRTSHKSDLCNVNNVLRPSIAGFDNRQKRTQQRPSAR